MRRDAEEEEEEKEEEAEEEEEEDDGMIGGAEAEAGMSEMIRPCIIRRVSVDLSRSFDASGARHRICC